MASAWKGALQKLDRSYLLCGYNHAILTLGLHQQPEQGDLSPVWYAWCLAWRDLAVGEFAPGRLNYLAHLLAAGRWLAKHHPEIVSPDQWTEELALTYRAALSEERIGQYAGPT